MTLIIEKLSQVEDYIGQELGPTEWKTIDQDQVNLFADATGDHQFIHVDLEKAKQSPFGTTIAHGFLTLSLSPVISAELWNIKDVKMGVNYGMNKVRFVNPVKVGSKVRGRGTLKSVTDQAGGKLITMDLVIEIEGEEKPACVAETLSLVFA